MLSGEQSPRSAIGNAGPAYSALVTASLPGVRVSTLRIEMPTQRLSRDPNVTLHGYPTRRAGLTSASVAFAVEAYCLGRDNLMLHRRANLLTRFIICGCLTISILPGQVLFHETGFPCWRDEGGVSNNICNTGRSSEQHTPNVKPRDSPRQETLDEPSVGPDCLLRTI